MLANEKFRKVLRLMGYKDLNKFPMPPLIINLLSIILATDTLLYVIKNRNDNSKQIFRLMGLKDINVMITTIGMSCDYMFIRNHMKTLLEIIDKRFIIFQNRISDTQKDIIDKNKKNQNDLLTKTGYLLYGILSVLTFLPLTINLYMIYGNKEIKISDLMLPIIFYYPDGYETVKVFIVAYLLQAIYYGNTLGIGFLVYGSVISSIHSLTIDIELFCHDIKNIDCVVKNDINNDEDDRFEMKLMEYTKHLIVSHQSICRYVKLTNECVSIVVSIANQCICFQICVFLFCIAEIDNKFMKLAFFNMVLCESSIVFIYCYNGQKIINGNEEMQKCLGQCNWIDKPQWFKKMLTIMLIKTNSPLHIKPFGLYILNLKSYTNIMNAAYSFYNTLRTLHK